MEKLTQTFLGILESIYTGSEHIGNVYNTEAVEKLINAIKERDKYCLSDVDMGIVSHYPNFEDIKKRMEESL